MLQQGGRGIYLSPNEVGLGVREPVKDVARVLGRMVDAAAVRTFDQAVLEEFAFYAGIPVINALSDAEHPCQALADLQTIKECKGRIEGLRIVYIGDGNNVASSLMIGAVTLGASMVLASPEGYDPPRTHLALAYERAETFGGSVEIVRDPRAAAEGADVLYTDVWVSMGQENETARRREDFAGFVLNQDLVGLAQSDAIVMHDLPAHRGEEIEDDVIEGASSVVFDQAENRLHAQKALLVELLHS
jgi:ornithine carbamoyltransferase